jgi:sodium/potassium-transporting ATPase subunit alpha
MARVTIVYTRWGNALFGTSPIELSAWLFVIPFGVGMPILEELRKYVARCFISQKRQ